MRGLLFVTAVLCAAVVAAQPQRLMFMPAFSPISNVNGGGNAPVGPCPSVRFTHRAALSGEGLRFEFNSDAPLQRVDVHYGAAGQPANAINIRMKTANQANWLHVDNTLRSGDGLRYWFSYTNGQIDCDTETFAFGGGIDAAGGGAAPLMSQQSLPLSSSGYSQASAPAPQPIMAVPPQHFAQPFVQQTIRPLTAPPAAGGCPAITFRKAVEPSAEGLRFSFLSADGTPLQRVDLHYGVNGGAPNSVNVRLRSDSPTLWRHIDSTIRPGDSLRYWYTYSANGVDCDTEMFNWPENGAAAAAPVPQANPSFASQPILQMPAVQPLVNVQPVQSYSQQPLVQALGGGVRSCPGIQFDHNISPSGNGVLVSFRSLSREAGPIAWVDAHWGSSNPNEMNVRLRSNDGGFTWEHNEQNFAARGPLRFYFTYSINGIECDTQLFGGNGAAPASAPAPILQAPIQQYAAAPAPAPILTASVMAPPASSYNQPTAPIVAGSRSCPVIQFEQNVAPVGNGLALKFRSLSREAGPLAWIDAHWGLNGPNEMNVRMKSTDGGFTWEHNEQNFAMRAGSGLRFYFTYSINGVECDTQLFGGNGAAPAPAALVAPSYAPAPAPALAPAPAPIMQAPVQQYAPAPAPIMAPPAQSYSQPIAAGSRQCPVIQFDHNISPSGNGVLVSFRSLSREAGPIAWVDAHWGSSNPNEMNVRLRSNDGGFTWEHNEQNFAARGPLRFYFTYSINGIECDTQVLGGGAPAALTAPSYAPAPAPIVQAPVQQYAPAPAPIMAPPAAPVYNQPVAAGSRACPVIQFDHTITPVGTGLAFVFRSLTREAGPLAWVDMHWGFISPTDMNVRAKSTDGGFTWEWTEANFPMRNGGAGLRYYFTYSVAGIDCDTQIFTMGGSPLLNAPITSYAPAPAPTPAPIVQAPVQSYAPAPAPAPIMAPPAPAYSQPAPLAAGPRQCPVIQFDHTVAPTGNGITLLFRSLTREAGPIAWVDAHWGFGSPTEMNVRMRSTDGGFTWEWTEPNWPMRSGGSGLKFYFTYCIAGVDCDTPVFTLGGAPTAPIVQAPSYAPAPVMQAPVQQYAPAPAPIVVAPVQQYAPAPAPIVQQPSYSAPAPAPVMQAPAYAAPAPAPIVVTPTYAPAPAPIVAPPVQQYAPAPAPIVQQPSYSAPQPVMQAPAYAAPQPIVQAPPFMPSVVHSVMPTTYAAPQPVAQAPAYSAPQPIAQAPSYAPAPQPVMQAPTYAAPQPIVQAPAYSAPQPVMQAPAYAPAPQPIAQAPAYAAPQPIVSAPSYAPAPQPIVSAPAYGPPPVAPVPPAEVLIGVPTGGHGGGLFGGGGLGGGFFKCPITGNLIPVNLIPFPIPTPPLPFPTPAPAGPAY